MTVSALLYLPLCACACLRLSVWAFKLKWSGAAYVIMTWDSLSKPACVYVCVHTSLIQISWSLPFGQRAESSARNCEKSGPDDNVTISSRRNNSLCEREVHKHFTVTTMCHSLSPSSFWPADDGALFSSSSSGCDCVLLTVWVDGRKRGLAYFACWSVTDVHSFARRVIIREDENCFFFAVLLAMTAMSSPSFSSWTLVLAFFPTPAWFHDG